MGFVEILIIVLVFLVLGPRRIADLFRSLGRGAHDFVENLGRDKDQKEIEDSEDEDPPSPRP
ncbi:MAG TPA: twin-arginine translocase TatA/TatE family subunit [Rubrobacter sp.]|nr:twin-arginine translocase TatA/TatE family subunit [Rubrobacter sp.]